MPEPLLCRRYIASQLCWPNWLVNVVSGVEFYLRNVSIPTDGSGRLLITDIRVMRMLSFVASRGVSELRSPYGANDWYRP